MLVKRRSARGRRQQSRRMPSARPLIVLVFTVLANPYDTVSDTEGMIAKHTCIYLLRAVNTRSRLLVLSVNTD
ncbi:MAG: hypothetical protein KME22_13615 [Hassallia sp. WJT32-NPBG1]|nr:hypothetical protein [Hassallia sp. WJT32-NPBG1]